MLALTPDESLWRRCSNIDSQGSDVHGHSLGNLLIAALADLEGGFGPGLHQAERLLGAHGSVIPVASGPPAAHGRESTATSSPAKQRSGGPAGGSSVCGSSRSRTRRRAGAVAASQAPIRSCSDPGACTRRLIATLVVPGSGRRRQRLQTPQLVYVANLITQDGETLGMDLLAHLKALIDLAGVRKPTAIVAESGTVEVASAARTGMGRPRRRRDGRLRRGASPSSPTQPHHGRSTIRARLGKALERLTN